MTNEETVRKLTEMKMSAMADSYREQMNNQDYQDMSFEDRFNLLVDHEYSRRQSNKLQRLINQAQFNEPSAAIEDIEYQKYLKELYPADLEKIYKVFPMARIVMLKANNKEELK